MAVWSDKQIVEAVQNFPAGCDEQKNEFLKGFNLSLPPKEKQIVLFLTKDEQILLKNILNHSGGNALDFTSITHLNQKYKLNSDLMVFIHLREKVSKGLG